jgi:PPOX class probable F420-dependent enzyme
MTFVAAVSKPAPRSHIDLLTAPIVGVLTTLMPDGQPHSCLVWVDYDGECARVNTTLERQSGRNLLSNLRLSLLVVDPDNTARYIQIRGEAELIRRGAIESPGRSHPGLHQPSPFLWPCVPGAAARARDPRHRPPPSAPDHNRCDPPVTGRINRPDQGIRRHADRGLQESTVGRARVQ